MPDFVPSSGEYIFRDKGSAEEVIVIVLINVVVSVTVAVVVVVVVSVMVEVTGSGVHPANSPDKRMTQAKTTNLLDDLFIIHYSSFQLLTTFCNHPACAFPAIRQGFPYKCFQM
jgi:hypothetical protein